MSGPQRIQLRRTKGWRKPGSAVVVARPNRWGNHWRISHTLTGWSVWLSHPDDPFSVHPTRTDAHAQAVRQYRRDLLWDLSRFADLKAEIQHQLGGRDLCCWCTLDMPCHADVLLEVANR